jgi:hypothetical protein
MHVRQRVTWVHSAQRIDVTSVLAPIGGLLRSFRITHSIVLNTAALHAEKARWAKTTGKLAREYLDRVGSSINIRRLIHEYRAVLRQFADWLLTRLREIDFDILAEGKALHDELLTLLPPGIANELQAMAAIHAVNSWFDVPEPRRRD